jgi:predicted DNA-binding protein (MmcQ/YjbR family)
MTRDEVLNLCANLPGASEEYPFGPSVAVFKVGGRMFALVPVDDPRPTITLKCDPVLALALRARYSAVRPGYHTNKRHWNTVDLNGSVDPGEVREMIEHSYDLVVSKLPRRARPQPGAMRS